MISAFTLMLLLNDAPFQPGDVISYEHGEGLIAGDAHLNENGYWETKFEFGEVGASPISGERREIIEKMLRGEPLDQVIRANDCQGMLCRTLMVKKVKWPRGCDARDFYDYGNMDAVRIEWNCKGGEQKFNIVDFEDGKPVQFRSFDHVETIWVKDEN